MNLQFERAKELLEALYKNIPINSKMVITGHSLGGELASIGALATGVPTYTHNSAGLHPKIIQELKLNPAYEKQITAFYTNKVSKIISKRTNYELYYLPLTSVSTNKPIKYMELLLKYGADPNYFSRDNTGNIALNAMPAINAAVRSAYILWEWDREDFMNDIKARIELLLEYGADINSIGSMGETVVESANSNPEIVLYLMDKGADHRLYGKKC